VKLFYDTEFIEDGKTIRLLSIGMVAADGRELYRIVDDEETVTRAVEHPWVRANVLPHLPITVTPTTPDRYPDWDYDDQHADWHRIVVRADVASDVRGFIQATPDAELWAWYGAYDHVALCQLFGAMVDLPEGVPMWTNDLKQEVVRLGNPTLPKQDGGEHNALADARWVRDAYASLAGQS
jgi:hypothetical protein